MHNYYKETKTNINTNLPQRDIKLPQGERKMMARRHWTAKTQNKNNNKDSKTKQLLRLKTKTKELQRLKNKTTTKTQNKNKTTTKTQKQNNCKDTKHLQMDKKNQTCYLQVSNWLWTSVSCMRAGLGHTSIHHTEIQPSYLMHCYIISMARDVPVSTEHLQKT